MTDRSPFLQEPTTRAPRRRGLFGRDIPDDDPPEFEVDALTPDPASGPAPLSVSALPPDLGVGPEPEWADDPSEPEAEDGFYTDPDPHGLDPYEVLRGLGTSAEPGVFWLPLDDPQVALVAAVLFRGELDVTIARATAFEDWLHTTRTRRRS